MGGIGSGNHSYRYDRKTTVEECIDLDVNVLARDGVLRVGAAGVLDWKDDISGEELASVVYSTLLTEGGERIFHVAYCLEDEGDISIPIPLQTTRPNYGGQRWWFTCPLVCEGVPCNRRVAKLYMEDRYFGCRQCLDLTYESCQSAHRVERLLKRMEKLTARLDERLRGKKGNAEG